MSVMQMNLVTNEHCVDLKVCLHSKSTIWILKHVFIVGICVITV